MTSITQQYVTEVVADLLATNSIFTAADAENQIKTKTYDSKWTQGGWEGARVSSIAPVSWWGDQMYDAWILMLKNETPQARATRLAGDAAQEVKSHNGVVSFSVHKKEDKWCKNGQMKFRVPTPCKYAALFEQRICAGTIGKACGKHVPEGQEKCSCGEILAGCWSHAKKGNCIYVHPDEEQWSAACSGELCFDRQQFVFHLRTAPLAAANRFVQLARNEKEAPAARKSRFAARVEQSYESSAFAAVVRPVVSIPVRESAY